MQSVPVAAREAMMEEPMAVTEAAPEQVADTQEDTQPVEVLA